MNIEHTVDNDHLTVILDGRLDAVTAPEVEAGVTELLPGMHTVDIDIAKVDYLSSAGLRALLALHRKSAAQQGVMNVLNTSPAVMDIFSVTGFDNVLNLKQD